jgi:hypothetical protein
MAGAPHDSGCQKRFVSCWPTGLPDNIWRVGGQMGHRDTKYIRLSALVAKGEGAELPDLECCKAPASSTKRLHVPLPIFVVRNPFGRGTLFHLVSNGSNLLARLLIPSDCSARRFPCHSRARPSCSARATGSSSSKMKRSLSSPLASIFFSRFVNPVQQFGDTKIQMLCHSSPSLVSVGTGGDRPYHPSD